MLQPRQLDDELAKAPPRELCFIIDVSGSMSGQPTAKVREIMERFFERAKPEDRIQVVTFASRAERLFSGYVPASKQNVERALGFTRSLRGGGGTQMLEGIRAVLQDPVDPERVRIVMLLSDGYIGNEAEIIREVGQRTGDRLRFWSLGIGSSPNRYLIDGVAAQGGGDSAVVGLGDDTRELVGPHHGPHPPLAARRHTDRLGRPGRLRNLPGAIARPLGGTARLRARALSRPRRSHYRAAWLRRGAARELSQARRPTGFRAPSTGR